MLYYPKLGRKLPILLEKANSLEINHCYYSANWHIAFASLPMQQEGEEGPSLEVLAKEVEFGGS